MVLAGVNAALPTGGPSYPRARRRLPFRRCSRPNVGRSIPVFARPARSSTPSNRAVIRLDDLVLIGPGSEWFWVMAQFLALAGTGFAIYRQLRAQRSATLFEHMTQWDREFEGPEMVRAKLALLLAIQGRDVAAGRPRNAEGIPDFFERLGYLVSRGHVDADDFWNDGAWEVVEFYWRLVKPYIERDRSASGNPDCINGSSGSNAR